MTSANNAPISDFAVARPDRDGEAEAADPAERRVPPAAERRVRPAAERRVPPAAERRVPALELVKFGPPFEAVPEPAPAPAAPGPAALRQLMTTGRTLAPAPDPDPDPAPGPDPAPLSPLPAPASPHSVLAAPAADDDQEVPLIGGDMTDGVVRVGRTVRRPMRPHTPAVHALLRHLEAVGFDGAPRVLGIDAQNREVLTHLPGPVPRRPLPRYALAESTLVALAELQLRYHQAVIGFEPPSWAKWDGELTWRVDGPAELICHCDINLENVIFEPGPDGPRPYALIDFDLARPGTRLVDVVQTLRYWAPLAAPADRDPAFAEADIPGRIAVFCEAYGLSRAERARLVPVAVRWLRRSRTTIGERAQRYGGAWTRMLEAGVGERLLRSAAWLEGCRPEIEARLSRGRV